MKKLPKNFLFNFISRSKQKLKHLLNNNNRLEVNSKIANKKITHGILAFYFILNHLLSVSEDFSYKIKYKSKNYFLNKNNNVFRHLNLIKIFFTIGLRT